MVFSKLTLPLAAFVATTEARMIRNEAFDLISDFSVINDELSSAGIPASDFSTIANQASEVALKGLSGYGGGFNPKCDPSNDLRMCGPFRRYDGQCTSPTNVSWGKNGEIMPRGFGGGSSGTSRDSSGMQTSSIYSSTASSVSNAGNIRSISDNHCTASFNDVASDGGNSGSTIPGDSYRSDATITWAQVMDHDLDATTPEDAKNCNASKGDTTKYKLGANAHGVTLQQDRTCPTVKNVITSIVDAGILYGETMCERNRLFSSTTGLGFATAGTDGEHLPTGKQLCGGAAFCNAGVSGVSMANPTGRSCFYAGDFRAGENPALTGYHALMLRMHNFIVRNDFGGSAPFGSTFENVRARVINEEQYITYNEWLPAYTGNPTSYSFGSGPNAIMSGSGGAGGIPSYSGWGPKIRPSVRQHFATGTFRQHTGVSHKMNLATQRNSLELDQSFFESCVWYAGGGPGCDANSRRDSDVPGVTIKSLCDMLAGQANTKMRKGDTIMITEQRNQLFYKKDNLGNNPAPYGNRGGESGSPSGYEGSSNLDLVALNVFRGRDHGLKSWTSFTSAFFGFSATNPNGFCAANGGCSGGVSIGSAVYSSHNEIDLWVGALAEPKVNNNGYGIISALGSTLTRDVVTQFWDLRDGDSRWDNAGVNAGKGLNKWLSVLTGASCYSGSTRQFGRNPFVNTFCNCRFSESTNGGGVGEESIIQEKFSVSRFGGGRMPIFHRRRLSAAQAAIPGSSDSVAGGGKCGHQ